MLHKLVATGVTATYFDLRSTMNGTHHNPHTDAAKSKPFRTIAAWNEAHKGGVLHAKVTTWYFQWINGPGDTTDEMLVQRRCFLVGTARHSTTQQDTARHIPKKNLYRGYAVQTKIS